LEIRDIPARQEKSALQGRGQRRDVPVGWVAACAFHLKTRVVRLKFRRRLRAYAAAGVREVWLVLAPQKQVEVWRLLKDGQFAEPKTYGPDGSLSSVALPQFTLDLKALFSE
jgi:hypothetical protein